MGKKTKTSPFGISGRASHDSSRLYGSRMYKNLSSETGAEYEDNSGEIDPSVLDSVILGDSRRMDRIPDKSVHLMVTSPPYNVTKEYDEDLTLKGYLEMLQEVFSEVWRVLVPGGRAAVNVANVGRKPYIPLHAKIIGIMLGIGFFMRGEIIWDKGASAGTSTAWGSFASASNPCLRDVHEYILIFSKQTGRLEKRGKNDSIRREDFVEWSKSVWSFPAESAKRIGHPAPFPEELPRRLIEFYTYVGDVVLDPFLGSGTTALAALKAGRRFIGYEREQEYVELAQRRIAQWKPQFRITDYLPGNK